MPKNGKTRWDEAPSLEELGKIPISFELSPSNGIIETDPKGINIAGLSSTEQLRLMCQVLSTNLLGAEKSGKNHEEIVSDVVDGLIVRMSELARLSIDRIDPNILTDTIKAQIKARLQSKTTPSPATRSP